MKTAGKFGEMVIYVESCSSGSLFADLDPETLPGVYAMTATSASGWAWASQCPPFDDMVYGNKMKVCLTDYWSSLWMEDTDIWGYETRTLAEQFTAVSEAITYPSQIVS